MKQVARGLAGYGRYGDNNLVHVSDQELRGIEQLTGRKFTRNPDTGLPEAFNFGDALKMAIPVIAGIAATAMTGGAAAPLVGAAASGLASAGVAKAEGKSTEDALTKGLISGVTSYAGGQLLSGVGNATGEVAGEALAQGAQGAAQGVAEGTANLAAEGAAQGATQAATQGATQVGSEAATGTGIRALTESGANITPAPSQLNMSMPGYTGAESSAFGSGVPSGVSAIQYSAANSAGPNMTAGDAFSQLGDRAGNIASDPGAAASKLGSNIYNNPQTALIAAGGTYAQMSDMGSNRPRVAGTDPYDPNKYPEQFPTNPRTFNAPSSGYMAGRDPEYRYFAKGGLASMRQEGGMTENVVNEAKAALLGEHPKPQDALSRFEGMFGSGALEVLRDRITGGRVRGAGGGMDDLIPGTIEGRQKVRLADSEFVLPADIVSAIGDGSTDHGVRRLHEMMNDIRKQKTGSTKQPARLKKGTLINGR